MIDEDDTTQSTIEALEQRLGVARIDVAELSGLLGSVLFDNADGILLLDPDGVIRTANPAAEKLLGRLSGELVGAPFGFPLTTDGPTELNLVGSSNRVVEMRVALTEVGGRQAFVATLRDVTARKNAEEALRNFVSMASHEFRTPITSISGFSETLLENWDAIGDEDKVRYLEVIQRQAARLGRLSTDLLSLSRLDEGPGSAERMSTLVRSVIDHAVAAVVDTTDGEADEIVVDVPADLRVLVDQDHLEEMLINYLANALKYGSAPVTVSATVIGSEVEVAVRDEGPGVPVTFRPKLFQRFARDRDTARRETGTGLGLSIVAILAERNGGRAWYRPAEPGSIFGVTLEQR